MELRHYWRIVRRRLWIIVLLLAALTASYAATASAPAPGYTASMRFLLGVKPEPRTTDQYAYDYYYTWLTSEYLVDDFSEVVKSRAFAEDVSAVAGIPIPPATIQGISTAGKLHRILTVTLSWHDPQELQVMADAVMQVIETNAASYFAQLTTESAVISVIDPPAIAQAGVSLRQRLDLPLRLILALVAGVAIVFALDYVDDSVRHRTDLEPLGVAVLAEIPTRGPWWRRLWPRRPAP